MNAWDLLPYAVILLPLATWRLTNLIVDEEGPWAVFTTLRHWVGVGFRDIPPYDQYGKNRFAQGLICVWCVSVWGGIVSSILYWLFPQAIIILVLPFAVSAGVIIVDTWVHTRQQE